MSQRIEPGKAPGGIVFQRWSGETLLGETSVDGVATPEQIAAWAIADGEGDLFKADEGDIQMRVYDGDSGELVLLIETVTRVL